MAEWKEIKVMKEELQNAENLVKTVKQMELSITKKLIQRPKSARNLLIPQTFPKVPVVPQKKLIEAFQERDKQDLENKMAAKKSLEKSKTAPEIRKNSVKKISLEEESTLLKPTVSSLRKVQPGHDEPVKPYDKTFELDARLMQIEHVPKLGLPHWLKPVVTATR